MRLIDADAMIADLLTVDPQYETMIDWCCRVVDAQPTIEPQRWIPCCERNPEIDMSYPHHEHYLVTYDIGGIDVATWSNVNPFWTDHVTEPRWWGAQYCKVVAWMPLPEQYREEGDS